MKYLRAPIPLSRVLKYSAVVLVLLVIGSPFLIAANEYRLRRRYERGLEQIRVGDSRQSVLSIMGEPDRHSWCFPLQTDHDTPELKSFHEQCVDTYEYEVFLKSYVFTFDRDNRVSYKGDMVSP